MRKQNQIASTLKIATGAFMSILFSIEVEDTGSERGERGEFELCLGI